MRLYNSNLTTRTVPMSRTTPRLCSLPFSCHQQSVTENQTKIHSLPIEQSPSFLQQRLVATFLSAILSTAAVPFASPPPSFALLNSPNAQIPRTSDTALRRSIPAFNEDVATMQEMLERVQFKLRIPQRKPWNQMQEDIAAALEIASDNNRLLKGVLPGDASIGEDLAQGIKKDLERLSMAVSLKDPDRTSIRVANVLERVASLELLQAPGLPYTLPSQYKASLPYLTGRAKIQLTVENSKGQKQFYKRDSEDGPSKRATIEMTVDGYAAPFTAGNFVYNASKAYTNSRVNVTFDSIFIGGNGDGMENTTSGTKSNEGQQHMLPLEFLPAGDFEPLYRTPLSVREGELPTLPLSIYGAVAMARLPASGDNLAGYVSDTQFFIYKYERQASGLAGLAFDEGQFPVFGYVTDGVDMLSQISDDDVVVRVKVVSGLDKLVVPEKNVD